MYNLQTLDITNSRCKQKNQERRQPSKLGGDKLMSMQGRNQPPPHTDQIRVSIYQNSSHRVHVGCSSQKQMYRVRAHCTHFMSCAHLTLKHFDYKLIFLSVFSLMYLCLLHTVIRIITSKSFACMVQSSQQYNKMIYKSRRIFLPHLSF